MYGVLGRAWALDQLSVEITTRAFQQVAFGHLLTIEEAIYRHLLEGAGLVVQLTAANS